MMANDQPLERQWSNRELITKEEDEVSSLPTCQLSPLDFSGQSGICPLNWEFCLSQEIPPVDDPLMGMCVYDEQPFSSLDFDPSYSFPQGDYYGFDGGFAFQNEMNGGFFGFGNEILPWLSDERHHQQVMILNDHEQNKGKGEKMKKGMCKSQREERNSSSKMLSREHISQFFYMPITQAAKQLNIGLTLLKKRCRELGIKRWPHRKLASLQTLIKNVHELSKDESEGAEEKLRGAIELLEMEKRVMEQVPDMQLKDKTKRLRQACFKANYKKRKIMTSKNSPLLYSTSTQASPGEAGNGVIDGDEEIHSLLSDCFSSSNAMFLV